MDYVSKIERNLIIFYNLDHFIKQHLKKRIVIYVIYIFVFIELPYLCDDFPCINMYL